MHLLAHASFKMSFRGFFLLVSFKILFKEAVLAYLLRSVKPQGKNPQGVFYEMVRHGLSGF